MVDLHLPLSLSPFAIRQATEVAALSAPRAKAAVAGFFEKLEPNLGDDVKLELVVSVWRRVLCEMVESVLVERKLGFHPRRDRLPLFPFPQFDGQRVSVPSSAGPSLRSLSSRYHQLNYHANVVDHLGCVPNLCSRSVPRLTFF